MHKIMMIAGLFLAAAVPAGAQSGVQNVHEVATSTNSITQTISICGTTRLDVAAATSSGTLAGHFAIEVFNVAASSQTVVCGFDSSLSNDVTSAWYGREVAPGSGTIWQKLSNRILYCINAISGCTRATITQMK